MKKTILVMSGKGGVGKTTVAVNLAYCLANKNYNVGLLDIDIHGPNVPKMLGLSKKRIKTKQKRIQPIELKDNFKVMSIAFFLEDESQAVIWRGPMKHNMIKQFIEEVDWGTLDYLIVDCPPGTGDEVLSIAQLNKPVTGTIIVSTPQQVALLDAMKSVTFAKQLDIPVLGIIENMSGDIFGKGGAEKEAKNHNQRYLGNINLDSAIRKAGDSGKPFAIDSNIKESNSFQKICDKIINLTNDQSMEVN